MKSLVTLTLNPAFNESTRIDQVVSDEGSPQNQKTGSSRATWKPA